MTICLVVKFSFDLNAFQTQRKSNGYKTEEDMIPEMEPETNDQRLLFNLRHLLNYRL